MNLKEFGRMQSWLEVLSQHSPGSTEEKHEKLMKAGLVNFRLQGKNHQNPSDRRIGDWVDRRIVVMIKIRVM
jgi:hypothetical protein